MSRNAGGRHTKQGHWDKEGNGKDTGKLREDRNGHPKGKKRKFENGSAIRAKNGPSVLTSISQSPGGRHRKQGHWHKEGNWKDTGKLWEDRNGHPNGKNRKFENGSAIHAKNGSWVLTSISQNAGGRHGKQGYRHKVGKGKDIGKLWEDRNGHPKGKNRKFKNRSAICAKNGPWVPMSMCWNGGGCHVKQGHWHEKGNLEETGKLWGERNDHPKGKERKIENGSAICAKNGWSAGHGHQCCIGSESNHIVSCFIVCRKEEGKREERTSECEVEAVFEKPHCDTFCSCGSGKHCCKLHLW